jgi:hypothetical protein
MGELNLSCNDIDFGHSYLRFSSDGANHTPRIRLDAVCSLVGGDGEWRSYFLGCACLSENMYRQRGLIQEPVSEFTIVLRPGREFQIMKRHADAASDVRKSFKVGERMPTHDGRGATMLSIEAHVKRAARTTAIATYEEFRDALLGDHTINARTSFVDGDGETRVVLDYPASTTNVAHDQRAWQVDAGPILFPMVVAGGSDALEVERMELAYVVFNAFEYAEFAANGVTMVGGGATRHYARPFGLACRNELFVTSQDESAKPQAAGD